MAKSMVPRHHTESIQCVGAEAAEGGGRKVEWIDRIHDELNGIRLVLAANGDYVSNKLNHEWEKVA